MAQVKKIKKVDSYKKFDQLDGSHPFKNVLPKGHVDYPARIRKGGRVRYFNFDLAREMGLIPKSHDNILTKELEKKILETFSIQIINEYDHMKGRVFPQSEMKSGTYMATRYLQLQHEDKKGRTSGDGRSVWNGQVKFQNRVWDVSSCGTGGTRLSPATSKYNKFFETGDPSISYGCGYAEVDEGLATAILSKIFHLNNFSTEQNICIIEFPNNISINVRAHECLIRPSHIFLYLKQDDLDSLQKIVDFYIERQRGKSDWEQCPSNKRKYDFLAKKFCEDFAKLSANFEDQYIFCWLDWDGDNILMDGGIIDYGSVRQFGLFHHEYRYDDVERYSTNIIEQKSKAKYIVQTMLQAVDYIKTGEKKNIQDFVDHDVLQDFEDIYENQKNHNLLTRMGVGPRKTKQLLKRNLELVTNFRKVFTYFEKAKSIDGIVKISDGVTCDAIFSMRDLLRQYPQILLHREEKVSEEEFIDLMRSQFAQEDDLILNQYKKQKINEFQTLYMDIVSSLGKLFQEDLDDTLLMISQRSNVVNKSERITGDAATYIIDLVLKNRDKLPPAKLYELLEGLTASQNLNPDKKVKFPHKYPKGLLSEMIEIIREHREGI